jgi:hypothetical protein
MGYTPPIRTQTQGSQAVQTPFNSPVRPSGQATLVQPPPARTQATSVTPDDGRRATVPRVISENAAGEFVSAISDVAHLL